MSTTPFSKRGIAALAILCTVAVQPALGQQPTQPPPTQPQQPTQRQQKEHVVRQGETLWDLARMYFNDPFRWPLIYDANKNLVANPHRIFPTERLVIPGVATPTPKPKPDNVLLGVEVPVPTAVPVPVVQVEQPVAAPSRSRFYSAPVERGPTLISSQLVSTTLVQPREWQGAPWISDSAALTINGKIQKAWDPRLQNNRLRTYFHPQENLILTTFDPGMKAGDRLLALRLSRNLKGWGWVVEPQAILRVDSIGATRAVAFIETQFADLHIDDLTIPLPNLPVLPENQLTPVSGGPVGEVLELMMDQPLVGTTEIAFVTLGAAQGITIGDELLAYIPERRATMNENEILPEQAVARMRVIKVTDDVATVRVIGLHSPNLQIGLPVRVSFKAP